MMKFFGNGCHEYSCGYSSFNSNFNPILANTSSSIIHRSRCLEGYASQSAVKVFDYIITAKCSSGSFIC